MSDPRAAVGLLAAGLLKTTVDAWDADCGRTAPSRRQVCWGDPAFDCELVAVSIGNVQVNDRGSGQTSANVCAVTLQADLSVWVVRCAPTVNDAGTPPSAGDETESALGLAADVLVVASSLVSAWQAGTLFGPLFNIGCHAVRWSPVFVRSPLGGMAGWSWPLRLDLAAVQYA